MANNRAFLTHDIENSLEDGEGKIAGRIYDKIITLTNAELKALNTTAKELVAAPGAGRFIEFVSAVLHLDVGSEILTESADNLDIEYDSGTGPAVCTTIECTGFIEQTVDQVMLAIALVLAGTTTASSTINKNLVLLSNEGDFAGNASADAVMKIKIAYRIHDFN